MAKHALQPGIPLSNTDSTAGTLLALLGPERTGELIEALLAHMDAFEGDPDLEGVHGEGLTDDDEPAGDEVDTAWPESAGAGCSVSGVDAIRACASEDAEDDDPAGGNVDDQGEAVDEDSPIPIMGGGSGEGGI